ncbi:unnamed protein product [Rotaria socialis]
MEHDPYSLIKYINVINANNDGYGDPTINAFVEMGLLETNEILFCRIVEWINGTEFARGGDSGSLYFVHDSTTNAFVPVAMHVGSKEKRSFGILLTYIFEELAEKRHQFLLCDSIDCQKGN